MAASDPPAALSPEALMRRVTASNDPTLSPEETEALEAVAHGSAAARGLLGMHYYRARRFDDAARHAARSFEAAPSPETANNLWSALSQAGRVAEGLAHLDAAAAHFDPIDLATARCTALHRLGRAAESAEAGRAALALKDAETAEIDRPAPVIRRFDPNRPERNVIAFSLFGADPRYAEGAVRNAVVAPHLYPGWTPRFYIDDSVAPATRDRLRAEGAQLRMTPKLPAARYGLFWRFLVEDDPEVDLYLIRDADSVINIRERAAVADWLESGAPYHVMRDHPVHCVLMLAGMWGAHRGNLGPMGERILAHVRGAGRKLNDRTSDQLFLRRTIWPLIRRDALVHDSVFGFRGARPFPEGCALPGAMHVGQNDAVRRGR